MAGGSDPCVLHPRCSSFGSPTAYRFAFGSPTRLVRFGLVDTTVVSGSVGIDGALPPTEDGDVPSASAVSTAGSAAFFLRPRVGEGLASASPGDA